MGLDMTLSRKSFVKTYQYTEAKRKYEFEIKRMGYECSYIKPERIAYVEEEVGYWRKFNALHNWFVKYVQNGVDNCGTYQVSSQKLKELLLTLQEVQAILDTTPLNIEKLEELLPTVNGFFFGSTQYDDYYKECVNNTIELLINLLAEEKYAESEGIYGGDYFYHSSW